MPEPIRYQHPQLPPTDEVERYFARAEADRWYSNSGPCHHELTRRIQEYLGQDLHCVPLANATLALAVAIRALVPRSSPKTEVIVPSFTFTATAGAVVWAGLRPVFVDVDPEHWHPTEENIRAAGSGDTALVLACSTFGTPPPDAVSRGWSDAADALGVPLLVDSAAGFGSVTEQGRPLGAQGDAEVFSFHATKPFGIGEGGVLVSHDEELIARVRRLANFGFEDGIVTEGPGLNAKLAEWSSATALALLDRFGDILATRRAAAAELVRAARSLGFSAQRSPGSPVWQAVPLAAGSDALRDAVITESAADDIEVRASFSTPLHRMPVFRDVRIGDRLTVTEHLAGRILSLPMANDQSPEDRARIVAALSRAAGRDR